jgi:peroxisomal enoyl-CoA hydratase 2
VPVSEERAPEGRAPGQATDRPAPGPIHPPYRFPVEAGHILTFARALGDPNPIYTDEAYARSHGFPGVLAPPTFYEAGAHFDPRSEVRPRPGQPWFGSSGVPTGDPGREDRTPGTTMHAETHVTYRRHVCAGEVLEVRHRPGERWTKVGRRGGELAFEDWYADYHDRAGEVVLTARTVAVTTAQKIDPASSTSSDTGSGASTPPGQAGDGGDGGEAGDAGEIVGDGGDTAGAAPGSPGDGERPLPVRATRLRVRDSRRAVLVRDLRRVQIIQYAGASGDFSPQHTDEVYNTQVAGYPTVFAHGMLTMGMTGRLLTDWLGDARLTSFGMRFMGQVWPGDDLIAEATVESIDRRSGDPVVELSVVTVNQRGEPVIRGSATARALP